MAICFDWLCKRPCLFTDLMQHFSSVSVQHVLCNLSYLLRVPIPVIAIYVMCAINSKKALRQESVKERKLDTLKRLNFDQLWKCKLSWSRLWFHSMGLNMCVSCACCAWLFSHFQPFGVQKPQIIIRIHFPLSCTVIFHLFHLCDFMMVLCCPEGLSGCFLSHNKQIH